jgi:hypothetical protein
MWSIGQPPGLDALCLVLMWLAARRLSGWQVRPLARRWRL